VPLLFEPPEITREKVCAPALADDQLAAEWQAWDGKTLPDRSPELIRRELQRLMDKDAIRWFDTIETAFALMPGVDNQFGPDKAMLARAELLIAAGRLKDLTNQQLVPQLLGSEFGKSPRVQNILSGYLIEGIGIEPDAERGMQMLVAAGYGGNADALLKIVALEQAGRVVPGWNVPQDIAVTMAFGALVGKLDPMICDRVARVAREYMNGTVVTRDVAMAEKWFRFAADMGDSASAWKVAEMHMRSEDVVKSNDILIEYLTKAADGDLPYAQITLGRAYENGALVPRDLEKARTLYARAAAFGDRAGVVRNTLFLQAMAKADPAELPAYRQALTDLAARPDSTGWAYIALADLVIREKGRWAGEAEAVALLEKAEAMGDIDASKRLTPIRFRHAETPAAFYKIIDDVVETVHLGGEIDPMNGLRSAFICRAPNAPQQDEASFWGTISVSTGTKTVEFSPQELLTLIANPDPEEIARLQSQALYGRQTAVAQYIAVLERSGAPPAQVAFWETYGTRFESVWASRGRLEAKFAQIGRNLHDPAEFLRRAVAQGDEAAGLDLAEYLMQVDPTANTAEALAAIQPLVDTGVGAALRLLPKLDPARFPSEKEVYAAYADVIDQRGDFDALVLALPYLTDTAQRADYVARATTATDCGFAQAKTMAEAMGVIGDKAGFEKWVRIGDVLTEEDSWSLVQLGDLLRRFGGPETVDAQLAYYDRSFRAGNVTAIHRLLDVVSRPGQPGYDPARSADLFVALLDRVEVEDIPRTLARLATTEPAVKNVVYTRIDVTDLYLGAAVAGVPVGMREYGKILTAQAKTPADLETATQWVANAARAGDVPAMVIYADALAFGIGVEPSRDDALIWLAQAAEGGNADAKTKMQNLALALPALQ